VPSDAGAGCNGAELMYNVTGDEVDVVVTQTELGITYSLPP